MLQSPVRVLVADDHPDAYRFLGAVLAPDLEIVGVAINGCMAVDAVSVLHPDVILMDYHMPVMDGLTATACIKQSVDAPKIVLFTSEELADVRRRATAAGVDGMLQKGCDFGTLRQTLLDVVAAHPPLETQAA